MTSMRIAIAALVLTVAVAGCREKADRPREKTVAEKAFDAGQNAKKKAEALKAEQDKKTKEANDVAGH